MVHTVLEAALLLLTVLGFGAVLWLIWGRPLHGGAVTALISARGDGCELEQSVRGQLWLRQSGLWQGRLILLDCGLSEEGRSIARRLAGDHPWIILCGREELPRYLERLEE